MQNGTYLSTPNLLPFIVVFAHLDELMKISTALYYL